MNWVAMFLKVDVIRSCNLTTIIRQNLRTSPVLSRTCTVLLIYTSVVLSCDISAQSIEEVKFMLTLQGFAMAHFKTYKNVAFAWKINNYEKSVIISLK